jgi:hypothetical protein
MKSTYGAPRIQSEKSFETSALACGKTVVPPAGSRHFQNWYDTFTGHFGGGLGASESVSGAVGVGGIGDTSQSYHYAGLCTNWVTYVS